MRRALCVGLVLVACMAIGGLADDEYEIDFLGKTFPYFPYCPCDNVTAAYKLDGTVKTKGKNTFCFTVKVDPPAGCTDYCCTTADLRKIELDVEPNCKVTGQILSATINGKPAATTPTIEKSVDASTNSYIFKLTNMGLNRGNADGAEICITLGDNKPGACTTLEQLCKPPPGQPAGTCNTALFDSRVDCCGLTPVPNCETCAYVKLTPPATGGSYVIDKATCTEISNEMVTDLTSLAAANGAAISTPFKLSECTESQVKVCGAFASAAEGQKLQDKVVPLVNVWTAAVEDGLCTQELNGYDVVASIGGNGPDGSAPPASCLNAIASTILQCSIPPPPFPFCKCAKDPHVTPYSIAPNVATEPGRSLETTLYCFQVAYSKSADIPATCPTAGVLNKVEFFAQDKIRRKVTAVGLQAATASKMRFISPSWGPVGGRTLKASPLGWNSTMADGAKVCLEVSNTVTLQDICMGNRCWLSLFDVDKKCCPLYSAQ